MAANCQPTSRQNHDGRNNKQSNISDHLFHTLTLLEEDNKTAPLHASAGIKSKYDNRESHVSHMFTTRFNSLISSSRRSVLRDGDIGFSYFIAFIVGQAHIWFAGIHSTCDKLSGGHLSSRHNAICFEWFERSDWFLGWIVRSRRPW